MKLLRVGALAALLSVLVGCAAIQTPDPSGGAAPQASTWLTDAEIIAALGVTYFADSPEVPQPKVVRLDDLTIVGPATLESIGLPEVGAQDCAESMWPAEILEDGGILGAKGTGDGCYEYLYVGQEDSGEEGTAWPPTVPQSYEVGVVRDGEWSRISTPRMFDRSIQGGFLKIVTDGAQAWWIEPVGAFEEPTGWNLLAANITTGATSVIATSEDEGSQPTYLYGTSSLKLHHDRLWFTGYVLPQHMEVIPGQEPESVPVLMSIATDGSGFNIEQEHIVDAAFAGEDLIVHKFPPSTTSGNITNPLGQIMSAVHGEIAGSDPASLATTGFGNLVADGDLVAYSQDASVVVLDLATKKTTIIAAPPVGWITSVSLHEGVVTWSVSDTVGRVYAYDTRSGTGYQFVVDAPQQALIDLGDGIAIQRASLRGTSDFVWLTPPR
ncbi:hypothetical protein [Timonella senegalensis]|uniref:hypothetical protein n=1 Tax=Timonella senegalensis TaxID=1465825 RepID=UPI000315BD56|nr:hypothetical protein [Timonella senegalensis]